MHAAAPPRPLRLLLWLLLPLLHAHLANAQAQPLYGDGALSWVAAISGAGTDNVWATAAVDGTVFVAGQFQDTVTLGVPGATVKIVSAGYVDGFIAALRESDGAVLWTQTVGGTFSDAINSVALTADNSTLVIGGYYTLYATMSGFQLMADSPDNNEDAFLASLQAADGRINWVTYAGNRSFDSIQAVAVAHNVVVATGATLSKVLQWHPALPPLINRGITDTFVVAVSLDDASPLWALQAGGAGPDVPSSIAISESATIAVVGGYMGEWTVVGPNNTAAVPLRAAGAIDALTFAVRVSDGSVLWTAILGGTDVDTCSGVLILDEFVFVVGQFVNSALLAVAGFTGRIVGSGRSDSFLYRLQLHTATVDYLVMPVAGPAEDGINAIARYGNNVALTGYFTGTVSVLGANSQLTLRGTTSVDRDIFAAGIRVSDGSIQWAAQAGGPQNDQGACISMSANHVFVGGFLRSTVTFGGRKTGEESLRIAAAGGMDGFLASLGDVIPPYPNLVYKGRTPSNSPLAFSVVFSEYTSGMSLAAVVTSSGTLGAFRIIVPNFEYAFNVSNPANGPVHVHIAAGRACDPAGNCNLQSAVVPVIYDTVRPTASIVFSVPNPTNARFLTVTVTFSECIAHLTLAQFNITYGIPTLLTSLSNCLLTAPYKVKFTVVEILEGPFTVALPSGAATDLAGNPVVHAATTHLVVRKLPIVTLSSPGSSPTRFPIPIVIQFDIDVYGFDLSAVRLSSGAAYNLTTLVPRRQYSVACAGMKPGSLAVHVPADVVTDLAGNLNAASPVFASIIYDTARPQPAIRTDAAPYMNTDVPYTIDFSEPVYNFRPNAILLSSGFVAFLNATDASLTSFRLLVSGLQPGRVLVTVLANHATDAAGNLNLASAVHDGIIYDDVLPLITLSSPAPYYVNQPIQLQLTFSEHMRYLSVDDLILSSGLAGRVTSRHFLRDGVLISTFNASVFNLNQGPFTARLPAGVALDNAGNGNQPSNVVSLIYDSVPPECVFTSTAPNPTSAPIPVTLTCNEPLLPLQTSLLLPSSGRLTLVQRVTPSVYHYLLTDPAEGHVTIGLPLGAAEDLAHNFNIRPANLSAILYDVTPPNATIVPISASPTRLPVHFQVIFSEPLQTPFVAACIRASSGDVRDVATILPGLQFSFRLHTPHDGYPQVSLAAGCVLDLASNPNIESQPIQPIRFDSTLPSWNVSAPVIVSTDATILVHAMFTEPISAVLPTCLTVSSGAPVTVTPLNIDRTWFEFRVLDVEIGRLHAQIKPQCAADDAGNLGTGGRGLYLYKMHEWYSVFHVPLLAASIATVLGAYAVILTWSEAHRLWLVAHSVLTYRAQQERQWASLVLDYEQALKAALAAGVTPPEPESKPPRKGRQRPASAGSRRRSSSRQSPTHGDHSDDPSQQSDTSSQGSAPSQATKLKRKQKQKRRASAAQLMTQMYSALPSSFECYKCHAVNAVTIGGLTMPASIGPPQDHVADNQAIQLHTSDDDESESRSADAAPPALPLNPLAITPLAKAPSARQLIAARQFGANPDGPLGREASRARAKQQLQQHTRSIRLPKLSKWANAATKVTPVVLPDPRPIRAGLFGTVDPLVGASPVLQVPTPASFDDLAAVGQSDDPAPADAAPDNPV